MYKRNIIAKRRKRRAKMLIRKKAHKKERLYRDAWTYELISKADHNKKVMYWIIWSDLTSSRTYSDVTKIKYDIDYYTQHKNRYYGTISYPLEVLTEDRVLIKKFEHPFK